MSGFLLLACNAVTGADGILLSDDDFNDTSSGGVGGSASTGPTTGPNSGATTNSTTTAGATTNTSTASSTATASNTSSTASSSSSSSCQYPAGPYGVKQGDTVPPTLSWEGYRPGDSSPSTFDIEEFFDCDGTKGINALMIETSQYG